MTAEDGAAYRALRLRAVQDHPEMFGASYAQVAAVSAAELAAHLGEAAASEDDWCWGAYAPELIGTTRLRRYPEARLRHKASLSRVYVTPEMRGRGIARALMELALARARAMPGLEKVTLSVVADNVPAVAALSLAWLRDLRPGTPRGECGRAVYR